MRHCWLPHSICVRIKYTLSDGTDRRTLVYYYIRHPHEPSTPPGDRGPYHGGGLALCGVHGRSPAARSKRIPQNKVGGIHGSRTGHQASQPLVLRRRLPWGNARNYSKRSCPNLLYLKRCFSFLQTLGW